MARIARLGMSFGCSLRSEQPSQNWSGQGESDCLIKTKHCDGLRRCWRNVISASALNVKVMKFKQARVNGGSNYDSLKVAKCLVI